MSAEFTPQVHRAANVLFSADSTDAVCFGWVPQAQEALAAALDVEEMAKVLGQHNIECTGVGVVTCRGCRENGWMSWPGYRLHLATALRAAILGPTS